MTKQISKFIEIFMNKKK